MFFFTDKLRMIFGDGVVQEFQWALFVLTTFILSYKDIFLQELEKSLKATCEEFIMSVTKLVVDPMLSFVTKVIFFSL